MKKRKGEKKNNSFSDKKFIAIVIVAFFVFAIALNFVSISDTASITGHPIKGDFVSNLFTNWDTGSVDVNIAKYLMFFIVILFIFSILNITGIPPYAGIQWLLSILVSFLAVAYITPAEVFSVLTTYTALGLALTSFLPFLIMVLASASILSPIKKSGNKVKVVTSKITVGKIFFVILLWIMFTGFLIYKLIVGYGQGQDLSTGMGIVFFAVLGISVFIVIFNKAFRKMVMRIGKEIKETEKEFEGFAIDKAQDFRDKVEERDR